MSKWNRHTLRDINKLSEYKKTLYDQLKELPISEDIGLNEEIKCLQQIWF